MRVVCEQDIQSADGTASDDLQEVSVHRLYLTDSNNCLEGDKELMCVELSPVTYNVNK